MSMKKRATWFLAGIFVCALVLGTALIPQRAEASGITVYKDGDKFVKVGGRIQLQYHLADPDGGASTDDIFFRRLRPFIEGSIHKDWKGKFQWDMGEATGDNEISIKDAYLEYLGFKDVKVIVGNTYFRFSREALTSSKKQQLIERTFVGDHNYGSPDRNAGVAVLGTLMDKKIEYGVSLAAADIDPDQNKLDFDTPVNKGSDFNQGWMYGARVSFHPFGHLGLSQGDLGRSTELKGTVTVAGFGWNNDDDNNTHTNTAGLDDGAGKPDVDSVTGFEVSGALRYMGASIDAEFNIFSVDTIDGTFTGGIYNNGTTDLTNYAVEGGYMVIPGRVEVVAAFQAQDADNYAKAWTRTSFGANLFFHGHDIKGQVTYRIGKNLKGLRGNDEDELFVQAQYVF